MEYAKQQDVYVPPLEREEEIQHFKDGRFRGNTKNGKKRKRKKDFKAMDRLIRHIERTLREHGVDVPP